MAQSKKETSGTAKDRRVSVPNSGEHQVSHNILDERIVDVRIYMAYTRPGYCDPQTLEQFWQEWYEQNKKWLWQVAYNYCGVFSEAEEFAQDAVFILCNRLKGQYLCKDGRLKNTDVFILHDANSLKKFAAATIRHLILKRNRKLKIFLTFDDVETLEEFGKLDPHLYPSIDKAVEQLDQGKAHREVADRFFSKFEVHFKRSKRLQPVFRDMLDEVCEWAIGIETPSVERANRLGMSLPTYNKYKRRILAKLEQNNARKAVIND